MKQKNDEAMSKEQILGALVVLLTVKGVARTCNLSPRTIWRLHDSGRMPGAVNVGSSVRWRASDIDAWIGMGCPDRTTFEARKAV